MRGVWGDGGEGLGERGNGRGENKGQGGKGGERVVRKRVSDKT